MRLLGERKQREEGCKIEWLKFERIAGEGESALYALYIDGERVGDALAMEEVIARIAGKYERETDGREKYD